MTPHPDAAAVLQILDQGTYAGPTGPVSLGDALADAVAGARVWTAEALRDLAARETVGAAPAIEVRDATTAAAIAALGAGAGALVFAQATEVGGGFLRGERGQEEDLCRSSGLFRCWSAAPAFHRAQAEAPPLLHASVVASFPGVPVFRADDRFLPAPVRATLVASSAPDARTLTLAGEADTDLGPLLTERVRGQLAVFRALGVRTLVLGAWGCGAYGNDPRDVAMAYRAALREEAGFGGAFDRVVFAISSAPRHGIPALSAFHRVFAR